MPQWLLRARRGTAPLARLRRVGKRLPMILAERAGPLAGEHRWPTNTTTVVVSIRKFLDEVWPTLSRIVNGVLGSRHPEVDDVVQQSLIAVLQALIAFRGECHPAGYASRIALHVALRARRQTAVRRARSETLAQISASDPNVQWPGCEVSAERRKKLLRDLLTELPEEQADALALRTTLGWSSEEVAQATGAPLNTVRSRVRLGKEALRRRIEADPTLADELRSRHESRRPASGRSDRQAVRSRA